MCIVCGTIDHDLLIVSLTLSIYFKGWREMKLTFQNLADDLNKISKQSLKFLAKLEDRIQ